jgi:hypothetical protein
MLFILLSTYMYLTRRVPAYLLTVHRVLSLFKADSPNFRYPGTSPPRYKKIHCRHYEVWLMRGPQPLPKQVLHRVLCTVSSFNLRYPLFYLR